MSEQILAAMSPAADQPSPASQAAVPAPGEAHEVSAPARDADAFDTAVPGYN